jgi:hypothetical protein
VAEEAERRREAAPKEIAGLAERISWCQSARTYPPGTGGRKHGYPPRSANTGLISFNAMAPERQREAEPNSPEHSECTSG